MRLGAHTGGNRGRTCASRLPKPSRAAETVFPPTFLADLGAIFGRRLNFLGRWVVQGGRQPKRGLGRKRCVIGYTAFGHPCTQGPVSTVGRCHLVLILEVGRTSFGWPNTNPIFGSQRPWLGGARLAERSRRQCCGEDPTQTDAISAEASEDTARRWDDPLQETGKSKGWPDVSWQTVAQDKDAWLAMEHIFVQSASELVYVHQCREAGG